MEKIKKYSLPALMLVCSIILLVLGAPRFMHELMLVPGTPIHEQISQGEEVSDKDLDLLEETRVQALEFAKLPDAYNELGASYLTRARRATTVEERERFAKKAIDATNMGLDMAPLDTFSWARVTSANILLGENFYPEAVKAWRLSIAAARFEPFILIQRVHQGIILYAHLNQEDIDLLIDQLEMAYRWDKYKTRQYARKLQLGEWFVFLSSDQPEAQNYFQQ